MIVKDRTELKALITNLEIAKDNANDVFELTDKELNTNTDFYNRIAVIIEELEEMV